MYKNIRIHNLHDRHSRSRIFGIDHTVVLLVDIEWIGLHFNIDVVLFSRIGWYSPRVPAGETSSILETAALNDFALGVFYSEFGF
jgi:hypothetical protein